jgi:hypothetical protein
MHAIMDCLKTMLCLLVKDSWARLADIEDFTADFNHRVEREDMPGERLGV